MQYSDATQSSLDAAEMPGTKSSNVRCERTLGLDVIDVIVDVITDFGDGNKWPEERSLQ